MKNKWTFTTRWEVVSQMRRWTMKWDTQDWQFTIDNIQCALESKHCINISRESIHRILQEQNFQGLHLLCIAAVDGWLSKTMFVTTHIFLTDYLQDLSILTRIVTCDETWIHQSTPSMKKQTMVRKQAGKPTPKKSENGEIWGKDDSNGALGSWTCTVYRIPASWEKERLNCH